MLGFMYSLSLEHDTSLRSNVLSELGCTELEV